MSRILVTPEMLLRVAAQCSNAHEQLESMIHSLNQSIHTLASGWEGTTRSRFYADFQRAHREMTQTTEHIQRTSLELKAIAQRFKAVDERVQPIQVAGHTLGAFPMMRGPAGYRAVDNAGRKKVEESWNAVQHEAGEFWEGLKIGAMQFGSSLKDTAISLFEDPLGTGKSMLYNATIGTAEDIRDTAIWAGRMLFSNEYRDKVVEDTMQEVEAAGGWSTYLGTQSAMIIGGALLNRAGLRVGGPRNNKHDDLGGGNSGGSGSGNGGSDRGGGNNSGDGDGKKSGDEGKGDGSKPDVDKEKWLGSLKNTENFKQGSKENGLNHIFDGEILKNGNANGFHYEGMPNSNGKVVGNVDPPNKFGVYQANVEINGVLKGPKSTFFPRDWTPQQVIDSVNEAFDNRVNIKNNKFIGKTSTGMKIEIILRNDKIISAYPIY